MPLIFGTGPRSGSSTSYENQNETTRNELAVTSQRTPIIIQVVTIPKRAARPKRWIVPLAWGNGLRPESRSQTPTDQRRETHALARSADRNQRGKLRFRVPGLWSCHAPEVRIVSPACSSASPNIQPTLNPRAGIFHSQGFCRFVVKPSGYNESPASAEAPIPSFAIVFAPQEGFRVPTSAR
jgi:hypothetical protein